MIHKQILEIIDEQSISVPVGSVMLDVKEQNQQLAVWYWFDEEEREKYGYSTSHIKIVGTGNTKPNLEKGWVWSNYVGTVLMSNGLVWHVFADD